MKYFERYLITASLIAAIGFLSSCINTETLEPDVRDSAVSNKIVLNLSAPEGVSTRASDGFKLRYVAKIYNSTSNGLNDSYYKARQELVQGEPGPAGKVDQMVFNVEADQNYKIFVFADYIPADFKPDEDGFYSDYYYDTHNSGATAVTMLSVATKLPESDQRVSVSKEFFNNDNYDCFAAKTELLHKTDEKIEEKLTLNRIVAKVRLVDNTGIAANINADVSNVLYLNNYDINLDTGSGRTNNLSTIKLDPVNFNEGEEKEILYFYTFVNRNTIDSSQRPNLTTILTAPDKDISDGSTNTTTIVAEKIEVQKNYITTVKGDFMHGIYPEPEPEDPTKGPIYLDLSISSEQWGNSTFSSWTNPN